MPIYEYACAACGHEFEEWQKMSDAPVRSCPKCKKKKVERLISRTAFQLKGSGWYETDFKSDKEAKRNLHGEDAKPDKAEAGDQKGAATPAKAEGSTETKAEGKAEAKAETKAETKPEPKAASKSAAKPTAKRPRSAAKAPARKAPRRR